MGVGKSCIDVDREDALLALAFRSQLERPGRAAIGNVDRLSVMDVLSVNCARYSALTPSTFRRRTHSEAA